MKIKFSLLTFFLFFLILSRVYAVTDVEPKYTTSKCGNYTISECSRYDDCTWVKELNCGIRDISTIDYTCYYWLNKQGKHLVTAYFNSKGLNSVSYLTTDDMFPVKAVVKNSGPYTKEKNGVVYYTCPNYLFDVGGGIFKDEETNLETIKRTFTSVKEDSYVQEFPLSKLDTDSGLIMGIKEIKDQEVEITPEKEPKICKYTVRENNDVRVITVTYHSDTKISATCTGMSCVNFSSDIDVSKLYESEEFKNWECKADGVLYVTHPNNIITISYDKDLLEGDEIFDYDDGGNPDGGTTGNKGENVDKCDILNKEILNYIMDALRLIRWVSLALVVILGTLDFVKAAAADDQDSLKKAWKHFVNRLIAVVILFIIPLLVDLILRIAGIASNCDWSIY